MAFFLIFLNIVYHTNLYHNSTKFGDPSLKIADFHFLGAFLAFFKLLKKPKMTFSHIFQNIYHHIVPDAKCTKFGDPSSKMLNFHFLGPFLALFKLEKSQK